MVKAALDEKGTYSKPSGGIPASDLADDMPFFTLPEGGEEGQALVSDGNEGAEWGNPPSSGSGLTEEVKQALLDCFENVAWINDQGQTYYDALYAALYPPVDVLSISAVFTQGDNVIYGTDSLDTLKQYLVVTATMTDSTTRTVTDYTLSGTLAEGTSVITVSYGGKTDTFEVTVTEYVVSGWYYPFNDSLLSSGTKDFGFAGVQEYSSGVNGGKAYYHHVGTEGTPSTDPLGIAATNIQDVPDMTGDFTISIWHKSVNDKSGIPFIAYKYESGTIATPTNPTALLNGWANTSGGGTVSKGYKGVRVGFYSSELIIAIFAKNTDAVLYGEFAPPAAYITSNIWHHYAITRKNGTLRFFVDGEILFEQEFAYEIAFPDQVCLGNNFGTSEAAKSQMLQTRSSGYYDDLFVSEYCKWDSAFNPNNINY